MWVGVNTWKFELEDGTANREVLELEQIDVNVSLIEFINFGGTYAQGVLEAELGFDDLKDVQVIFGDGISQKAHRFTVGGQGPGVAAEDYIYEDYVDVPFQVWDTENNVQLMVSFRDQQEDGKWDLKEADTDTPHEDDSREYLYIHDIDYSESPSNTIAKNGGYEEGLMYFMWPTLAGGADFDTEIANSSSFEIRKNKISILYASYKVISDAYGQFTSVNEFTQDGRETGLHPDQHNILIYDVNSSAKTFRLMIANDGGVYKSLASKTPGEFNNSFTYISHGYNTTQFYGADKAPGEERFIGGTQDNGTWYHPKGTTGSASSSAKFGIGGDGFEALWHSIDADKMIGGYQFNGLGRTSDGGETWYNATVGFDDVGNGLAPFYYQTITQ